MNIALVVHDFQDRPGHGLYTKILAESFSQKHDVTVFANTSDRDGNERWQLQHVRAQRSTALACVQTFPLGMRAYAENLSNYQIQHSQGYCGGNPNIVTAHICVAAYLESLQDISRQTRLSLRLMAAAEARFYQRYRGRIIAVSWKIAEELTRFYKVRGPIRVIPHGVDTNRFNRGNRSLFRTALRRELNIPEDQTTALYVGDLTKAHKYLKELSLGAPAIQFVVVTASKKYRWQANNVQFLQPTPRIEHYYAAADAFVFPTTYDAFGMVLLEAMASGLTVFTSDRAGAAELIDTGNDGFVLPLDEWVVVTANQLQERSSLSEIGKRAEQTAQKHDWHTVVNAVEQEYLQIVGWQN